MSRTERFQYPGDPVTEVEWTTGQEFLNANPIRETRITVEGEPTIVIPVGDEIICDCCNAEVLPADECALALDRLHCMACATKWIVPYLLR